jgi:integrase
MPSIEKRALKSGGVSYTATVRVSGFPSKCATFSKYSDARDWAQRIESDMRGGRYSGDMLARKHTVGDMIQRYLDHVLESKSTRKHYIKSQGQQLRWWKGEIGQHLLIHLQPMLLTQCKEKLAGRHYSKRKPATINRYFSALNHVINTAIKEWGWLHTNPIEKITLPKEPRGRIRYLTDQEREALLAACRMEDRKPLYTIVVFAISTGARKSEILSLKSKDVDFKRQCAVVYETKNHEPRTLYLSDYLCALLKEMPQRRRKSPLVFASANGNPINIEAQWRKARKRAGITDFRFHDLRHTAASYLAMNGASTSEIGEVLGHKSYDMVKRYSHLSTTHVAGVVASMNEKIFGQGAAA